ncbi:hypothetical protein KAT80_00595 [Candidatus Pacearchaeota archaeon]|nr:hypothetical protein [Candidatus Pacearchaeota archaeon]
MGKFLKILSTRQQGAIFFFLIGLLMVFSKQKDLIEAIKGFGYLFIIFSILVFIGETKRKYEIIKPYKKNHYDSQKEEIIANYFKRKNIIYRHHPVIKLNKTFFGITIPFLSVKVEPDFFLPEFEVFVEYWGMIDNKEYKNKSYDYKKKLYKTNDVEFISLYPKNLDNLDFVFTSKLLDLIKERQGLKRNWR